MEFFATAAKGTEPALRDELRELGLPGVRADRGGVHFQGGWVDGYRACFWSRIALRILTPLGRFAARGDQALYDGVRAVDWEPFLTPRHTLAVSAACRSSQLTHTQYIAQKTKDAIVDSLRDRLGERPSVEREDPDVHVFVHLVRDEATVYLDLAGESLHRRGYRPHSLEAPLKETLAASVLRMSGWDRRSVLIDPMCGSGTILVEAAMWGAGLAPGRLRDRFGFERWACHDADRGKLITRIREEEARALPRGAPPVIGYDMDERAIEATKISARNAGVRIRFERRTLRELLPEPEVGIVVTNPPYGKRLEVGPQLASDFVGAMRRMRGYKVALLAGSREIPEAMPFRADKSFTVFNGDLECRLFCYTIHGSHAGLSAPCPPGCPRIREALGSKGMTPNDPPQAPASRARRVFIALPDRDFDVTEVAVPWRLLTRAGHEVVFGTETGETPAADPRLLSGVIFGQLGADPEPRAFYREMEQAAEFRRPARWAHLDPARFDGLVLPGGHAPGMRQYLESRDLQQRVAAFWASGRPVGAICHGVVVLARTRDPRTGKSVLFEEQTTCLPAYMEATAYLLTFWTLGRYYRTYPQYVEAEVREALRSPGAQFRRGPVNLTSRGTGTDDSPAFVVESGRYLSARWPGDAYLFARRFAAKLSGAEPLT